jgi:hypothetical protein
MSVLLAGADRLCPIWYAGEHAVCGTTAIGSASSYWIMMSRSLYQPTDE